MVKYHVIKLQGKVDDLTGDVEERPGINVSDGIARDCREGILRRILVVKYVTQLNNSISKMKTSKVLDAISVF